MWFFGGQGVKEHIYIVCPRMCCLHLCLCAICVLAALRCQKRASNLLKLELQVVMTHCMGVENPTQVLFEGNQCS